MSALHPFTKWARLLGIISRDEGKQEAKQAVRFLFEKYGHGLGIMSSDVSHARKEEAWELSMAEEVRVEIEAITYGGGEE